MDITHIRKTGVDIAKFLEAEESSTMGGIIESEGLRRKLVSDGRCNEGRGVWGVSERDQLW